MLSGAVVTASGGSEKNPPPFLNSKGGGCKTLCASDQSIAGLLKKNTVLYDFILEISFPHDYAFRCEDYMPGRGDLSTKRIVF